MSKTVASQDHEYLITTDMSLCTEVPTKTLLSIYGMYPQGYLHSLSDKELIYLFLSSKEKYLNNILLVPPAVKP